MPGLCFANELISWDEGLHCDFTCHLHCAHLVHPATPLQIWQIFENAVQIEQEFIQDTLPIYLIGMNLTRMCQYIKFCADHLMIALWQPRIYEVSNPFEWMEAISLQGKTKTSSSPRWGTLWHFAHSADAESQVFVLFIHE
jgi:ribonucleotide reductase beta subunit family protein with ferritin-like domain